MTNKVPVSELKWRCRRGMLELDVCLHKFLQHGYDDFDWLMKDPDLKNLHANPAFSALISEFQADKF